MDVYALLTPFVILLGLAELGWCLRRRNGYYSAEETVTGLGTAIANQCVNLAVAVLVMKSYGFLHARFALFSIPDGWLSWAALLVALDFLFYWFHRLGHSVNVLWAAHMPHHSAEEFNLGVALRASVTQRLFSFAFYWPLTIAGWAPERIYAAAGVHLVLGYWHHTRLIGKLGWWELVFNSPSHHRVHHGTNQKYLDKNFGELLIVWDRLFGTFEPETEEARFGVTDPPRSWDPWEINFQYYKVLWRDMRAAPLLWDKIRLWFMPLGWRPRGLPPRRRDDARPRARLPEATAPYLAAQAALGLLLTELVIFSGSPLSGPERAGLCVVLGAMVTAWGGFLDGKPWAARLELARLGGLAALALAVASRLDSRWLALPALLAAGASAAWLLSAAPDGLRPTAASGSRAPWAG